MRRNTSKRLRVAVVALVAVLVAVIAGAAVALAGPIDGHPDGQGEVCFWDQFSGINQESGAGSYSQNYTVLGQTVTVHFSWTADKHLTISVTGGWFTVVRIKAGDNESVYYDTAGPINVYYPNPAGNAGNALSHLDFCLMTEITTTTTEEPTTTTEEPTTTTEEPTTTTRLGSLLITKTIEGNNPQGLDYEDFEIAVTGPNSYQWNGPFDSNGEIHLTNLVPGLYTVNEQDPGYPFSVSGEGGVTVVAGGQTGVTIINTGSTSTTAGRVTTTTGGTETTQKVTTTTVPGATSTTQLGWVAEPDDIQTGFGGTAGGSNWALIVLVLASTMLVSAVVASAVGIRAGVL